MNYVVLTMTSHGGYDMDLFFMPYRITKSSAVMTPPELRNPVITQPPSTKTSSLIPGQ